MALRPLIRPTCGPPGRPGPGFPKANPKPGGFWGPLPSVRDPNFPSAPILQERQEGAVSKEGRCEEGREEAVGGPESSPPARRRLAPAGAPPPPAAGGLPGARGPSQPEAARRRAGGAGPTGRPGPASRRAHRRSAPPGHRRVGASLGDRRVGRGGGTREAPTCELRRRTCREAPRLLREGGGARGARARSGCCCPAGNGDPGVGGPGRSRRRHCRRVSASPRGPGRLLLARRPRAAPRRPPRLSRQS